MSDTLSPLPTIEPLMGSCTGFIQYSGVRYVCQICLVVGVQSVCQLETGLMKGILCDCRSFDKENTGKISEKVFKQIMLGKGDVSETDIDEMLQEYYR